MRIISDVINQISHKHHDSKTDDSVLSQELANILNRLLASTDDIDAVMISSVDGLARAQKLSADMDPQRFAAMSSALLALSDTLVAESHKGKTENVLIEGSQGKILILHASTRLLLTVFTRSRANLGISLAHARQATEEINALMEILN